MSTKEVLLDFPTAIANVLAGKRITRLEWADRGVFGVEREGYLMLHRDNQWFQWVINDGDLHGADWVVLD